MRARLQVDLERERAKEIKHAQARLHNAEEKYNACLSQEPNWRQEGIDLYWKWRSEVSSFGIQKDEAQQALNEAAKTLAARELDQLDRQRTAQRQQEEAVERKRRRAHDQKLAEMRREIEERKERRNSFDDLPLKISPPSEPTPQTEASMKIRSVMEEDFKRIAESQEARRKAEAEQWRRDNSCYKCGEPLLHRFLYNGRVYGSHCVERAVYKACADKTAAEIAANGLDVVRRL